jgi:glycosyltransferase involved in cell wall biosynthesis
MKVAYINADPDVPVFGMQGCSVHVQEMLIAFLKRGDDVHLFTARLGDDAPSETSGLTVHLLPGAPRMDLVARETAALAANYALLQMLSRESEKGAFDLVYERYSLWSHAGMEFARERKLPSVLEVNAPLIEERSSERTLINRSAAEDVAIRAFRSATLITAVSRELSHILERHPSARGKVHVVPNAVNPQRFAVERPLQKEEGYVVGFVGTLKAWHGLTTLVEGFARLAEEVPAARLLIIGGGPDREQLDRDIGARNFGARVHCTGAIPPESVPEFLTSVDVAVAPYPRLANFYFSPLKIYEYMAAGLAIVASRIGQVEEIIRHDQTGILIPPGDATAMANALIDLYRRPERRARLGAAARRAVLEHTWDDAVSYILSLVELEKNKR